MLGVPLKRYRKRQKREPVGLISMASPNCAHRRRFESQQHACRVIGDWIQLYNHRRPHQALGTKTPAERRML
jgi:transposase InsO family protein